MTVLNPTSMTSIRMVYSYDPDAMASSVSYMYIVQLLELFSCCCYRNTA